MLFISAPPYAIPHVKGVDKVRETGTYRTTKAIGFREGVVASEEFRSKMEIGVSHPFVFSTELREFLYPVASRYSVPVPGDNRRWMRTFGALEHERCVPSRSFPFFVLPVASVFYRISRLMPLVSPIYDCLCSIYGQHFPSWFFSSIYFRAIDWWCIKNIYCRAWSKFGGNWMKSDRFNVDDNVRFDSLKLSKSNK